MNIKRTENGFAITRPVGVVGATIIEITINEACLIYEMIERDTIQNNLIYYIREYDEFDWDFVKTQEEVISDEELINDLIDILEYEDDIDISDTGELYDLINRLVETKWEV